MKVQFTTKLVHALVNDLPTREEKQKLYVEKQGAGRSGRSLILSVSYGGAATWQINFYRDGTRTRKLPDGSEKLVPTRLSATAKLGSWPEMTLAEARQAAREFTPPVQGEAAAKRAATFAEVAARWLIEHVEANGLRTAKEAKRHLHKYVFDGWGALTIHEIDQDHVNDLLDRVAEEHGPVQADRLLNSVSSLMKWWRLKDKSYARLPPAILRGMRRGGKSRRRVLSDDEVRVLWRLTGDGTVFSGLVRTLLLTGQRLTTVHTMKWSDIGTKGDEAGVWTVDVPDVDRQKGTIERVRLPSLALDTLKALPRIVGSHYVFPGLNAALVDVVLNKRRLHEAMAAALASEHGVTMERWTLHDLRRSFRTRLGERCKVDPLTAELVIGHRIPGVHGIYDRGGYFEQKSEALDHFATHLLGVVGDNVVQLRTVTTVG
jgi:integrase